MHSCSDRHRLEANVARARGRLRIAKVEYEQRIRDAEFMLRHEQELLEIHLEVCRSCDDDEFLFLTSVAPIRH
jgi:hypothetical protein